MTAPDAWEALDEWSDVPAFDDRPDELIVFSAHPDDETLGVGGLLARAAVDGIPVRVVVAAACDPGRMDELDAALATLGLPTAPAAAPLALGLPDGALKHHADDLRTAIAEILDTPSDAGNRLVLAPWTGDRHGDHRTLGREVVAAARERGRRVLLYPVWLWQWGTPADVPWRRVREVVLDAGERSSKRTALAAFASQLRTSHNPDGVLEPGFVERAADGREVVIEPPEPADQHFERMHHERDDPWRVRTRWYERRRRAVLAASLPRERYGRAVELGCSIGETTSVLADRCDELIAVDGSASAVEAAAERLRDRPNVVVERMRVPQEWPAAADHGTDLVIVSELAYYLAEDEWDAVIDRIVGSLAQGGEVLLCHWTGDSDDFAQSGEAAHARFRERSGLRPVVVHRDEEFVLEVLR
ncbi:PIG-L family deacetylase [Leifsonia sp. 1010]|uniref:PIG-L family deacetylase n=1 Tax=Leifsonia sp. 1010 TaxID=2817769 RepID=UPI0028623B7C|nr:PIG-L family deacetylase [Leifsonia sp. 1010]MDR6612602.1 LmbE family N-acetylglucosaminyl deacetylase [Leifsonia sp. 1010]